MRTIKASYTVDELFDVLKMIFFTNTKLVDLPYYDNTFEKSGMTQADCDKISQDIKETFDIKSPVNSALNWPKLYADILMQLNYEGRVIISPKEQNIIESSPKQKYTTHQIYDTLLHKLGNATKHRICPRQILGALMYYAGLDKSGKQFDDLTQEFRNIQDTFKIKIYASYTLNDVVSLIEWSLSKRGKLDLVNKSPNPDLTLNKFMPELNKQK